MALEDLQKETQEAADTLADLEAQIAAPRLAEVEVRARSVMTGLGFSEERMGAPAAGLSGGWRMRASLSAVLLRDDMDILILDEPTNFLDLVGIIWLRRYLEQLCEGDAATTSTSAPTLIVVSHDRDFISLCTDLIILKDQKLTYFHGDLPTYESSRAERVRHLTKMKDAQDKQKAHIEKSIQQNIRAGKANDDQNKLRQAKSRQKRLDDRWGMQVNARGGRFRLNDNAGFFHTSRQDIEIEKTDKTVIIALPEPPELRFPGSLISLEKVGFRYGARSPLTLEDITLSVGMGDRVGILGLNGAGKSTLVRLLAGETRPTVGNMVSHPRLRLGYYSQHAVEELQSLGKEDPSLTALSLLSREESVPDGGSNDEGQLRSLLGQLGLPGRLASDVPLGKLSGGQLVRCQLARLLRQRPHCLILDEVTTHLDYDTVVALRRGLCCWGGAVVLISHDRWFMRGVVEGENEDDSDEEEEDEEAGEGQISGRRVVYRLKGGKFSQLERGVNQFESIMEKRVSKMLP